MHEILCILLYLMVIVSPGSYTELEISTYEAQNQTDVDGIRQDSEQLNYVIETQSSKVQWIDIIDPDEN